MFVVVVVMFLSGTSVVCQQHDNIWLFGYYDNIPEEYFGGSMLNFSMEPPLIEYFEIPLRFTTSASICDSSGRLIAYSNGCQIMNGAHQLAENGDSINPGHIHEVYCEYGYPMVQGAVFIATERSNLYRLLHLWRSDEGYVQQLRSTDLVLVAPDSIHIVNKNVEVFSSNYSSDLTSVKHANGRDWWIVLPRRESSIHDIFLSTPDRVVYIKSQEIGTAWDRRQWSGQAVFSPDGTKFVRVNPHNGIHILDFDRCSGTLANPIVIPFNNDTISACGAAFSLDSRYLYVSASLWVYQFDMWSGDIADSKVLVATYDGFIADYNLSTPFFQQMLAPNGKIYITAPNSVRYLHVIHDPWQKGHACELEQHGLTLPALHAFSTPNFPHFRLGPIDGSQCDSLGLDNHPVAKWRHKRDEADPLQVDFRDLSYLRPEAWHWDFGDGTESNTQHPSHNYNAPGLYHVCLTVSNENSTDSTCHWIELAAVSTSEPTAADYTVFPNPFSDYIEIRPGDNHRTVQIRITDINGRVVADPKLSCPCRLYLTGLTPGVYFYTVNDKGHIIKTGMVMKVP